MWVNLVATLWILFDVFICLRTGYMSAPFPHWEWWAWLVGGGSLAVFAFIAQYFDSRTRDRQMMGLQGQLTEQKGILVGLGFNGAATLRAVLEVKDERIGRLTERVGQLEQSGVASNVRDRLIIEKRQEWRALTPNQRRILTAKLRSLPARINDQDNRHIDIKREDLSDCIDLADDLGDCFRRAGWTMTWEPKNAENSFPGISVSAGPLDPRVAPIADALREALGGDFLPVETRSVGILGAPPTQASAAAGILGMLNAILVVQITIGRKPLA